VDVLVRQIVILDSYQGTASAVPIRHDTRPRADEAQLPRCRQEASPLARRNLPLNQILRRSVRQDTQVSEHPRIKRMRRSRLAKHPLKIGSQYAIHLLHLIQSRLIASPDKEVAKFSQHSMHRAVVNVRVRAVQVGQRFLETKPLRLTHHPGMPWDGSSFQRNRQTQLERHIEARSSWTITVKLHPRQVMNRVVAFLNEFQDALQPPAAGRDFEDRPRLQAEGNDPRRCRRERGSQTQSRREYSEKPIPYYRCALVVRVWALFFAAWACLPLLFFIPTALARDPVFFLRATKLPPSVLRSIMPCVCFLAISINCRVRAAETPSVSAMSYGVAKRPRSLMGCRIVPKLYAALSLDPTTKRGAPFLARPLREKWEAMLPAA